MMCIKRNNEDRESNVLYKKSLPFLEDFLCGDRWARTTDSRIFSPMLYQLSYITLFWRHKDKRKKKVANSKEINFF